MSDEAHLSEWYHWNTPNRASDPIGTPIIVRVICRHTLLNMYVIRRYTSYRVIDPIGAHLIVLVTHMNTVQVTPNCACDS